MSSEGSCEAGGLETAKGAVRERIGLARQPRHSRVQGTAKRGSGKRGRDAFAKRLAIARFPLIDRAPVRPVLPISAARERYRYHALSQDSPS